MSSPSCLHWHTPRVGLGSVSLEETSALGERVGKIKAKEKQSQSWTCCRIVPGAGAVLAALGTLQVKSGMGADSGWGQTRDGDTGLR